MLLHDRIEHGSRPELRPTAFPAGHRPSAPDVFADVDDLPPELAFLVAQGVAPGLLCRAARIADGSCVAGEDALFGLGFPAERYARLLARHLGAPYLRRPVALAHEGLDVAAATEVGWARLAPHPGPVGRAFVGRAFVGRAFVGHVFVGHVFAPRGDGLRLLLDEHRFEDVGTYGFAITTRHRFEALLRRHDAVGFGERAASGLSGWDASLSARGGATRRQTAAALGLAAASAAGLAVAPGPTAMMVSVILFAVFAAAVAQRLLVVAAGAARGVAPPERPLPDRDLPVYTIVVPLFREARVLPGLVRALDALDYPALCRKRNKHHAMRRIRHRL